MAGRDLGPLLEAVRLDDVEATDGLLRLGERPVRDESLPVANANRASAARGAQPITGDPGPPCLQVVEPREALLVSLARGRLRLGLHRVGAPAHQQEVL